MKQKTSIVSKRMREVLHEYLRSERPIGADEPVPSVRIPETYRLFFKELLSEAKESVYIFLRGDKPSLLEAPEFDCFEVLQETINRDVQVNILTTGFLNESWMKKLRSDVKFFEPKNVEMDFIPLDQVNALDKDCSLFSHNNFVVADGKYMLFDYNEEGFIAVLSKDSEYAQAIMTIFQMYKNRYCQNNVPRHIDTGINPVIQAVRSEQTVKVNS